MKKSLVLVTLVTLLAPLTLVQAEESLNPPVTEVTFISTDPFLLETTVENDPFLLETTVENDPFLLEETTVTESTEVTTEEDILTRIKNAEPSTKMSLAGRMGTEEIRIDPFDTIYVADESVPLGSEKEEQAGVDGRTHIFTYTEYDADGNVIGDGVEETVITEMQLRIDLVNPEDDRLIVDFPVDPIPMPEPHADHPGLSTTEEPKTTLFTTTVAPTTTTVVTEATTQVSETTTNTARILPNTGDDSGDMLILVGVGLLVVIVLLFIMNKQANDKLRGGHQDDVE